MKSYSMQSRKAHRSGKRMWILTWSSLKPDNIWNDQTTPPPSPKLIINIYFTKLKFLHSVLFVMQIKHLVQKKNVPLQWPVLGTFYNIFEKTTSLCTDRRFLYISLCSSSIEHRHSTALPCSLGASTMEPISLLY